MPDRGSKFRAGVAYGDLQVITLAAATSLIKEEQYNGKTILLGAAGGFTVTLPPISVARAGWRVRFVVKVAPTGANYIITENGSFDTDKVTSQINNLSVATAGLRTAGHTFVNLIANQAVIGDYVDFFCDGAIWIAHGQTQVAAGATLT